MSKVRTTKKVMACPSCGKHEELSTIETLTWNLSSVDRIRPNGEVEYSGWTEVNYDSSTTVGVSCNCGWYYEGSDWLKKLKEKNDEAAS